MSNLVQPVVYHQTSGNKIYFAVTLPAKFTNDRKIQVLKWNISGSSITYEVVK